MTNYEVLKFVAVSIMLIFGVGAGIFILNWLANKFDEIKAKFEAYELRMKNAESVLKKILDAKLNSDQAQK